jgi:hypothetical protein
MGSPEFESLRLRYVAPRFGHHSLRPSSTAVQCTPAFVRPPYIALRYNSSFEQPSLRPRAGSTAVQCTPLRRAEVRTSFTSPRLPSFDITPMKRYSQPGLSVKKSMMSSRSTSRVRTVFPAHRYVAPRFGHHSLRPGTGSSTVQSQSCSPCLRRIRNGMAPFRLPTVRRAS